MKRDGIVCIVLIGYIIEESSELVEKVVNVGVDFIELVFYDYRDLILMFKDVKERVNIFVIVKFFFMIDEIGDFVKKLEEVGVDVIIVCDFVGLVFRIDIEIG